jgi:bifunctional DNA-binding transcriptional regulator/antitoxin component of YhaV-PrlF toxin-antitoxin module
VARKCVKYNIESLTEGFGIQNGYPVEIFIDSEGEAEINAFLKKNQKKFRMILYSIIEGRYPEHLYRREPHNTTAMKFNAGSTNPRVYCKEYFNNGKKVVMIMLLENKDFQKANNKKLEPKLKLISEYQYDFPK